jgi:biopolymer transport protein ExbD
MGAKLGSGGGPMADINVTPLIDVVLVLLVVFMVITPMLQSGKPVDLPQATQSVTVNDVGQYVVVSITPDKKWWVEQKEVQADTISEAVVAELNKTAAKKRKDGEPPRSILLKGDRSLEYQDVREVLDILGDQVGIGSVKLATAKEN